MTLVYAYKNRGITRDITIQDAAGNAITPGVNDKVRVSIGREGETPLLTVTSGTPTANGSSVTKGTKNRVRLDASDLNFAPGVYSLEVDYWDNADAQEWKVVELQTFFLEEGIP